MNDLFATGRKQGHIKDFAQFVDASEANCTVKPKKSMKYLFSFFGLLQLVMIFVSPASAQSDALWIKEFGGAQQDEGWGVIINSDGDYVVVGISDSFGTDEFPDGYVALFNSDGETLWQKVYESPGYTTAIESVEELQNGDYLIIGQRVTREASDFRVGAHIGAYYARIDTSGNLLWENIVEREYINFFSRVVQLSSGESAIAGFSVHPRFGNHAVNLIKVNSLGDIVSEIEIKWAETFDMKENSDGSISLLTRYKGGSNSFALKEIDSSNNVIADSVYFLEMNAHVATILSSVGSLYAGSPIERCFEDDSRIDRIVVKKILQSGEVSWEQGIQLAEGVGKQNSLGRAGSAECYFADATSAVEMEDGSFLIAASYKDGPNTPKNILLIKLDSGGEIIWRDRIERPQSDVVYGMIPTFAGDFFAVGATGSQGLMARYDANILTSLEKKSPFSKSFTFDAIYPNPASKRENVNISFSVNQTSLIKISIYDVLGRLIAVLAQGNYAQGSYQKTWEVKNATSGVYFVRSESTTGSKTQYIALK
ncbi:MAG: T9SS type A sorting domain-containing protein [Rhodothermales bacterium]